MIGREATFKNVDLIKKIILKNRNYLKVDVIASTCHMKFYKILTHCGPNVSKYRKLCESSSKREVIVSVSMLTYKGSSNN